MWIKKNVEYFDYVQFVDILLISKISNDLEKAKTLLLSHPKAVNI